MLRFHPTFFSSALLIFHAVSFAHAPSFQRVHLRYRIVSYRIATRGGPVPSNLKDKHTTHSNISFPVTVFCLCFGSVLVLGPRVCRLATYLAGIHVGGVLAVAPLRLRPSPSHSFQVGWHAVFCRFICLPHSLKSKANNSLPGCVHCVCGTSLVRSMLARGRPFSFLFLVPLDAVHPLFTCLFLSPPVLSLRA